MIYSEIVTTVKPRWSRGQPADLNIVKDLYYRHILEIHQGHYDIYLYHQLQALSF